MREAHVFGSARDDSQVHERSDIDVAVEGLDPARYFDALVALHEAMPKGVVVDLVRIESAPPELVAAIKETQTMPLSPTGALKREVENQLSTLQRLVEEGALMYTLLGDPVATAEKCPYYEEGRWGRSS